MLVSFQEGSVVVILVCPACGRSGPVRPPERSTTCDGCGERVIVPEDEETQPS